MVRSSFVFLFVSCPFVFRVHRLTPRFRHPSAHALRSPVAHRDAASDRLPAPPFPITGYGRHAPPMPLTGGAHPRPWLTRMRPASNAYGRRPPNLRLEVTCSGRIHRPPPADGIVAAGAPATSSCGILRRVQRRPAYGRRLRSQCPWSASSCGGDRRPRRHQQAGAAKRRKKERCGGQPYRMSAAP